MRGAERTDRDVRIVLGCQGLACLTLSRAGQLQQRCRHVDPILHREELFRSLNGPLGSLTRTGRIDDAGLGAFATPLGPVPGREVPRLIHRLPYLWKLLGERALKPSREERRVLGGAGSLPVQRRARHPHADELRPSLATVTASRFASPVERLAQGHQLLLHRRRCQRLHPRALLRVAVDDFLDGVTSFVGCSGDVVRATHPHDVCLGIEGTEGRSRYPATTLTNPKFLSGCLHHIRQGVDHLGGRDGLALLRLRRDLELTGKAVTDSLTLERLLI